MTAERGVRFEVHARLDSCLSRPWARSPVLDRSEDLVSVSASRSTSAPLRNVSSTGCTVGVEHTDCAWDVAALRPRTSSGSRGTAGRSSSIRAPESACPPLAT